MIKREITNIQASWIPFDDYSFQPADKKWSPDTAPDYSPGREKYIPAAPAEPTGENPLQTGSHTGRSTKAA